MNIVINYETDELTRSLDLQHGKSQISVISFDDINTVMSGCSNCYIPHFGPSGALEYIFLNTERAPLNNSLVCCHYHAINLTEIRMTAYDGYITPVVGPDLHGFFGYNDSIQPPAYNLDEAKTLLAQAGYPGGHGLPTIKFVYPQGSSYYQKMAQVLIVDLGQIGVTLQPQQITVDTYVSTVFACCGTNPSYPDMSVESWIYWPDFSGYEL